MLDTEGVTSLTFDLDIHWILFIAFNRGLIINEELKKILNDRYNNINDYDVIIGPTADDGMFDTLSLFFSNSININSLSTSLEFNGFRYTI